MKHLIDIAFFRTNQKNLKPITLKSESQKLQYKYYFCKSI